MNDLHDVEMYWSNDFYTMARCELGIQCDVNLGKNKAGRDVKGVKRNAWYARRYCAMSKAVEHTRQGKYSSQGYALEAEKRLKRKDSQRPKFVRGEAMANNTPLTDNLRSRHLKRQHSNTIMDVKSDQDETRTQRGVQKETETH